jgi:hypothetical protein
MGGGRMIPVIWLGGHPVSWDQAMLDDAFSGRMWPTGYEFEAHEVSLWVDWPEVDGAVVVVHGPLYADRVDLLNQCLALLDWCLVCVTSDEERRFPVEKLDHPTMAVWLQYPQQLDRADGYLPVGYPPHFRDLLPATPPERVYDWVFAGQVNHVRRRECVAALKNLEGPGRIEVSPGFTQGLGHAEYAELLSQARAVACPSGPESVDSFRVWESLEAGAVPLADGQLPGPGGWRVDSTWLWGLVAAGSPPFPVVDDWADTADILDLLPANSGVSAWWLDWKRRWCRRIGSTIRRLSDTEPTPGPVTVLIPTSPIAAHPDTAIIEATIASVRYHHPDAEIVVMCDGVRPEQDHYRARYAAYLERLTYLCARDGRIVPVIHAEHLHQAEMTRRALAMVDTPLVLFVEHDTPLVTDEPIDWPALTDAVLSGETDLVRFHYEAGVHPEHEHLMLDVEPIDVRGVQLLRTVQWSQRPHLASTGFYRRILAEEFPAGYVGMVEDRMHSVVHSAWREFGLAGWDRFRLTMYAPPGGNIKRSLHLDGRGDDEKWADS